MGAVRPPFSLLDDPVVCNHVVSAVLVPVVEPETRTPPLNRFSPQYFPASNGHHYNHCSRATRLRGLGLG